MSNENDKDIADLQARMEIVEREIDKVKIELKEQNKTIQAAAMEGKDMCNEIRIIKNMLEEMKIRRVRWVDVGIAIGVLFTGAVSMLAALQNNKIAQAMFELTKNIKP